MIKCSLPSWKRRSNNWSNWVSRTGGWSWICRTRYYKRVIQRWFHQTSTIEEFTIWTGLWRKLPIRWWIDRWRESSRWIFLRSKMAGIIVITAKRGPAIHFKILKMMTKRWKAIWRNQEGNLYGVSRTEGRPSSFFRSNRPFTTMMMATRSKKLKE